MAGTTLKAAGVRASADPESPGELSPTAILLIETAERLFGESGPEGISLRQIGVAAGQSNKFVVQYYFVNKQKLLEAIFVHRIPCIDELRGKLLAAAVAGTEHPDVRALLEVLMRPLAVETLNPDNRYVSFPSRGRFNEMRAQRWWQGSEDRAFSEPGTRVAQLILEQLSHLPAQVRLARWQLVLGNCLFAGQLRAADGDPDRVWTPRRFRTGKSGAFRILRDGHAGWGGECAYRPTFQSGAGGPG